MSSTLDTREKEQYKDKFSISDDPYSPSHAERFRSDRPKISTESDLRWCWFGRG